MEKIESEQGIWVLKSGIYGKTIDFQTKQTWMGREPTYLLFWEFWACP